MKQMDEMKLRSIFKDQVSEDVPLTTSAPVTPSNPQASDADEKVEYMKRHAFSIRIP